MGIDTLIDLVQKDRQKSPLCRQRLCHLDAITDIEEREKIDEETQVMKMEWGGYRCCSICGRKGQYVPLDKEGE